MLEKRAPESGPVSHLLVNFFCAQQVGHAIEALHYANGYHAADPSPIWSIDGVHTAYVG